MNDLLIISTGGTFNKVYDRIEGTLIVDKDSHALKEIAQKWLHPFEVLNLIGKDSLEMTTQDRLELLATLSMREEKKVLIVHGTDTMHLTAEYLADAELEKSIVLTGAMVPYSIDPIEASANFAFAYGYLQELQREGVFIAMNGVAGSHEEVVKDRKKGCFVLRS
jgi:L-asparaginase